MKYQNDSLQKLIAKTKQSYPIFSEYYKTPTGEKCPVPQMIKSVSKCQEAAKKLGLRYSRTYDAKAKYPPGCFADDGKGVVLFNRVDAYGPSDKYVGICLAPGECYRLHYNYWLKLSQIFVNE